jgi:16S rRNA C967 or C1407 C5-methylase (RsmB/RsmF family)
VPTLQYGPGAAASPAAALLSQGPVTLRRNRKLCSSAEALRAELAAEGVEAVPLGLRAPSAGAPDALVLPAGRPRCGIFGLETYRRGAFEVQDAGSQCIARAVAEAVRAMAAAEAAAAGSAAAAAGAAVVAVEVAGTAVEAAAAAASGGEAAAEAAAEAAGGSTGGATAAAGGSEAEAAAGPRAEAAGLEEAAAAAGLEAAAAGSEAAASEALKRRRRSKVKRRVWRVLDMCAGNGGKALAIASALSAASETDEASVDEIEIAFRIDCYDVDERKLRHLRAGAERAGVAGRVTAVTASHLRAVATRDRARAMVVGDEDNQNDDWNADDAYAYDAVLVDVPCSSTGALRRFPSLRWEMDEGKAAPAAEDTDSSTSATSSTDAGDVTGQLRSFGWDADDATARREFDADADADASDSSSRWGRTR